MTARASILIVDDDASVRLTIDALLRPESYDLHFAESGSAALDLLSGPCVDLAICDVMMPEIDGLEVCRAMKQHAAWRLVPIILLTALDGDENVIRGLEAGADEFLTKPIEGAMLRARARAMLRVRTRYQELDRAPSDGDMKLMSRRARLVADAGLTDREQEVLDLVLLGRGHHDIALVLGISERTSKFHQSNLLKKLGAESRLDLLRLFL